MAPFCWQFDSYGFMVAKNGCKMAEEGVCELMMYESC